MGGGLDLNEAGIMSDFLQWEERGEGDGGRFWRGAVVLVGGPPALLGPAYSLRALVLL